MSSTCMVIPMPIRSRISSLVATVAVLTLSSAWTVVASAAVPWHPDLATARRASEISHRPVLAIFTASWSSASTTLDRTTLASDEAVALITACFEPVCVDVDTNAEATRRMGITKVPTACVVTADDKLLSKFELPETPAGFVAAAARAVQEAAFASAGRSMGQGTTTETSNILRDFGDLSASGSGALPSFGGEGGKAVRVTAPADVRGTVPPGGKAITAVAAKVRMLSDFASDDGIPASGPESSIAASFRETDMGLPAAAATQAVPSATTAPSLAAASPAAAPAAAAAPTAALSPSVPPTHTAGAAVTDSLSAIPDLAATPPAAATPPLQTEAAPTRLAVSSAFGSTAPQAPLSIEPTPTMPAAPSQAAAGSAPWLGLQPQNQPPRPMASEPASPASAVASMPNTGSPANAATPSSQAIADARNAAAPQPPAATQPPTQAAPNASGSATALAETTPPKPSATASLLSAIQKPFSMFSKQPPAKKETPTGTTAAADGPTQTAAATATPSEPDLYGSMPVGLEGYCPVTLAERGVWVEGRAQWGARHRGRTYLFASAEQQKAFLADPDRYAPALSGDDPVLAFDAGKSAPGQRRYGVTFQSRTYLFSSTETRDAFAANPQRYTSGAMVAEKRMPAAGTVVR
jgi:YHS domain-containing protein/thioredoxin-like negative regulator of GroEL